MTTRRLAAIVAADVVGFSTMMERNEEGTLARLKALAPPFRASGKRPSWPGREDHRRRLLGGVCEPLGGRSARFRSAGGVSEERLS
jgi:hypothetical protein